MPQFTFTEFEAFAEAVQDATMSMRMPALEEPRWTLRQASVGSIRIQYGAEGGGNIAEGATVRDGWAFFHQISRSRPGLANGQILTEDEVFAVPPECEFCLACQPSHEWIVVVVPPFLLFELPQEHQVASSARPHVLKPPPHATRRFASLVHRFFTASESKPLLLDSPIAVQSFQSELVAAIRDLVSLGEQRTSHLFVRSHRQAELAIDLALSRPDQPLLVSELAERISVSERTLRRAFKCCYGLSPLEYLRIYRLHQARAVLRANCPERTTVTQVAFDFGFWDLGRFAGAYRQLFGELPSETLRSLDRS
jgi:AraC family transcriptional regulator, ethanolamine operon transcriptional activator